MKTLLSFITMKGAVLSFLFTICISFSSFPQTINAFAGNHASGPGYGGDGGPATAAQLYFPEDVICDTTGNLYIADSYNNIIRKVDTSGTIGTMVGNGYGSGGGSGGYSGDGGPATAAELYGPLRLTFDASNNLCIDDCGNNVIRKVNSSGIISTIAGNRAFGAGYSGNGGAATSAELNTPEGIAFDNLGNLYIADCSNFAIRRVNTSGTISTVAGNHINGYSGDGGPATAAELSYVYGLAFSPSANLYILDGNNDVIRMVNASGTISTVAGNKSLGYHYSGDGGPATAAAMADPEGIRFDSYGNLWIGDFGNNVIRMVNTSGIINTMVGSGYGAAAGIGGYTGDGGRATNAELYFPTGIAFDASGHLFVDDYGNEVIRKVTGLTTDIGKISVESNGLNIYPNPNNGVFMLQISKYVDNSVLTVYNVLGEQAQSQPLHGVMNEIDIREQPPGIYFYKVLNENGATIGNGKIILLK